MIPCRVNALEFARPAGRRGRGGDRAKTVKTAVVGVMALAVLGGCGAAQSSASGSGSSGSLAPSGGSPDTAAAAKYCTDQGGELVDRAAAWNTNADPPAWLRLAGRWTLCEFQSGEGDTATRISVDLVTLYSDQPTLAAVAYLSKIPPTFPPTPGANPAAYNCTRGLGGASQFGDTAAGGGWVNEAQPVFKVMAMCVFADGSAIDEWGITYYSQGTVRGADLATKMRYESGGQLPAIWSAAQ